MAPHDALQAEDPEGASRMVDRIRREIVASLAGVRRIIDDGEILSQLSAMRNEFGEWHVRQIIENAPRKIIRTWGKA